MDTATILSHVDHTLLKPESTWEQIKTLCDEAMEFGCATVCIPPSFVKQAAAFQTQELLRREYGTESGKSGEGSSEKYTVGDFSYSVTKSTESGSTAVEPYDTSLAVVGLLRAAGCLFSGVEAIE